MPKLYLFFYILIFSFYTVGGTAQSYTSITAQSLSSRGNLDQSFKNYLLFTADFSAIDNIPATKFSASYFKLNINQKLSFKFSVSQDDILAPGYLLTIKGNLDKIPDGYILIQDGDPTSMKLKRTDHLVYNGYMNDSKGGEVYLTVDGNFIFGEFQTEKGTFFIENADRFDESLPANSYVLYQAKDIIRDASVKCGLSEVMNKSRSIEPPYAGKPSAGNCKLVELAVVHDISMYRTYEKKIRSVENHAIAVMNVVNGQYLNDFNDEIRFEIVEQVIFTDFKHQPTSITTATNMNDLLDAFSIEGPAIFTSTYDLGQLWTARDYPGGTIGIAWVGAVCVSNIKYHVLQYYTGNLQSLRVLASHEIGHNFNCPHNFAIGGTCDPPNRAPLIMDPRVHADAVDWSDGTPNNCEKNSIQTVNNYYPGLSCLSSCNTQVEAQFFSNTTYTCKGDSVYFFDVSLGNVTSWSWSFPGGSPSSSTDPNPVILYNAPGQYDVTLTVNSGASTITRTAYITVGESRGVELCNVSSTITDTSGIAIFRLQEGMTTLFRNDSGTPNETGNVYSDYSCYNTPILSAGTTYNIDFYFLGQDQKFKVCFDYNSNGTIESNEVIINNGNSYSEGDYYNFSFTIPTSATTGEYLKFRIWTKVSGTTGSGPCDIPVKGEVEDYAFLIAASNPKISETGGCKDIYVDNVSGNSFIPFYLNGHIVAEINPNNQNLGTVNLKINDLGSVQQTTTGNYYLPRNWALSSSNSFNNNVTIRFYALDQELSDYNAATGGNYQISDLKVTWYDASDPLDEDCDYSNNDPTQGTRGTVLPTVVNYDQSPQAGFYLEFDLNHFTEFGIGHKDILPLEYLDFTADVFSEYIGLQWKTINELNNSHFIVQKTRDRKHFKNLGTIGTSASLSDVKTYNFRDNHPFPGINYYRLCQVDRDGSRNYSELISAYYAPHEVSVSIYPNPTTDFLQLSLMLPQISSVDIEITDLLGRTFYERKLMNDLGLIQASIDMHDFPAGVYFIRLHTGKQTIVRKLVKQ